MDTQTRHALKQDKFVSATTSGLGWMQENRKAVLQIGVPVVAALLALVVGIVLYNQSSEQAEAALGKALTTYSEPLRQPGQPADAGSFGSAAERAKAANRQFADTANRFGWLSAGKKARYFAGLTEMEMGQNSAAETDLKKAADVGDADLSSLAKVALANLYLGSGRQAQAIELYNQIIARPSNAVPASSAKLQLAEIYESSRPDEAKRLYAELKDKEKTTVAGQIAAQKLAGK